MKPILISVKRIPTNLLLEGKSHTVPEHGCHQLACQLGPGNRQFLSGEWGPVARNFWRRFPGCVKNPRVIENTAVAKVLRGKIHIFSCNKWKWSIVWLVIKIFDPFLRSKFLSKYKRRLKLSSFSFLLLRMIQINTLIASTNNLKSRILKFLRSDGCGTARAITVGDFGDWASVVACNRPGPST